MTKDADPRKVQEILHITLEGDGIRAGTINALALGEALVGITELTRELGKIGEYREHGAPEVRVVATAEGSFLLELTLETLGQWWAATRGVLTGPDATAIANLAGFVALLGEVIATLKRKGRRQVTDIKVTSDGQVDLELDGSEVISVDPEVASAVQSPKVQKAAKELLAPLAHPGITSMTINARTAHVVISDKEAAAIPEPASHPLEEKVTTFEAWVRFDRPDFGGDRWGVETPTETFRAVIEDADFLSQVDKGSVTLSKYSEFRVTVRVEPYITGGGQNRRKRYITKVRERRGGADDEHPSPLFDETEEPQVQH